MSIVNNADPMVKALLSGKDNPPVHSAGTPTYDPLVEMIVNRMDKGVSTAILDEVYNSNYLLVKTL